MNYAEAVEYINDIPKFTKKNKFEHTVEMMARLGHPERSMKIIHVAGTNGKGSVCAFLSSMLVHAGCRTALFTSPHLVRINERFRLNHRDCTDAEFLDAFDAVLVVVRQMQADGLPHATYFEFLYAMGMVMFEKMGAEYCVLETGLGGRLDATNTVERPVAAVITSISLDHCEYLGYTIPEIAAEKAGIIKAGVHVIYDAGNPEAAEVIRKRADALKSPAVALEHDMFEILERGEDHIVCTLHRAPYEGMRITVPYPADYQAANSSLALLAMEAVDPKHRIDAQLRVRAVRDTRWEGRMETVLPGVILDGAHNEDGVAQFVKTVRGLQEHKRIVMLFAAVAEKNFEKMIETICTQTAPAAIVVTEIPGSRNEPSAELGRIFRRYTDAQVTVIKRIDAAFDEALRQKGDGCLFCVGSLYLIGALKSLLAERGSHDQL